MRTITVLLTIAMGCVADAAWAEELSRPFRVSLRPAEAQPVRGRAVAFDAEALTVETAEEDRVSVPWSALRPRVVVDVHRKLLSGGGGGDEGADGNARAWVRLGWTLRHRGNGGAASQRALRYALAIDAAMRGPVEKVRAGKAPFDHAQGEQDCPANGESGDETTPAKAAESGGPVNIGPTQGALWGELSEAVMARSVAALDAFARQTQRAMSHPLQRFESRYFLFYTDLEEAEALRWAGLLDRMYRELCETFGVNVGRNVFRGKALVFVFQDPADYHRFQALMHQTNSAGTAGMCHCFGNGYVHIAFYRQADELDFAHVLVHESSHGFMHRYRAPPPLPSWVSEGLAEVVAARMLPQRHRPEDVLDYVRREIVSRGGLGDDFFDAAHIQGWQYPIAWALCDYMLAQSKERYRAFIDAIKDGKSWRAALEEDYGVSQAQLVAAFGRSLGLGGLGR